MAKRYIDADALYEQTAEWEARALAVVEKLNSKPLGEMDVNEITEWRKWSCVLNERSAFKHDVADAPTADVVERKKGKWIWMGEKGDSRFMCSVCNSKEDVPTCNGEPTIWWFCPNCGADMREETKDAVH